MAADEAIDTVLPLRKAYIGGMITPQLKALTQSTASLLGKTMREAIEEALADWCAKHGDDDE